MGLFKPYERTEASESAPDAPTAPAGDTHAKQRPTPTRKEAEAARRERLNPTLSPKEARRREREARTAARNESMERMEAAPGRVLARDWVDSRRGIAAWSMPILMVTLMISLLATSLGPTIVSSITYFTWAVLALIVIDIYLSWRGFKKLIGQRLPNEPLKGLASYLINRSINLRRLRTPAPRHRPGDRI